MNRHLATLIATCVVGRIPFAPGTFGSALGLASGWWIVDRFGWLECFVAFLAVTLVGVWATSSYLRLDPARTDPKEVVVDEVAGQWLTLLTPILLLHLGTWLQTGSLHVIALEKHWVGTYFLLAFLLFRVFDILKPWPISLADRKVKGAFGVMLDDLLAAVAAGVLLYAIYIVGPVFWEADAAVSG